MNKLKRILTAEGLRKNASPGDVEFTVTLRGSPALVERMKLLLRTINLLGNVGASRDIRISIDGDGADRLEVPELKRMDIAEEADAQLDDDALRITEDGRLVGERWNPAGD
jgi:hypothetical protein